ncbi:DUF6879 family protein [Streptomyces virginiae]|uniref:DUF6879 family protein n=1 Tax=Streptomyces virginiae TaxID=1961 RepID=UPI003AF38A74
MKPGTTRTDPLPARGKVFPLDRKRTFAGFRSARVDFPCQRQRLLAFDDRILVVNHFGETGRVPGSELIEDSDVVAECVRVQDLLWASAVAHRKYKP